MSTFKTFRVVLITGEYATFTVVARDVRSAFAVACKGYGIRALDILRIEVVS